MDTRTKILDSAAARKVADAGATVVSGYFDPLVSSHAGRSDENSVVINRNGIDGGIRDSQRVKGRCGDVPFRVGEIRHDKRVDDRFRSAGGVLHIDSNATANRNRARSPILVDLPADV